MLKEIFIGVSLVFFGLQGFARTEVEIGDDVEIPYFDGMNDKKIEIRFKQPFVILSSMMSYDRDGDRSNWMRFSDLERKGNFTYFDGKFVAMKDLELAEDYPWELPALKGGGTYCKVSSPNYLLNDRKEGTWRRFDNIVIDHPMSLISTNFRGGIGSGHMKYVVGISVQNELDPTRSKAISVVVIKSSVETSNIVITFKDLKSCFGSDNLEVFEIFD